jgi:hypothetical protein
MPSTNRLGIVAAGAPAHQSLAALGIARVPLLTRGGRTLLEHTCTSLLDGGQAGRVLVLAPEAVPLPELPGVTRAPYSGKLVADLFAILRQCDEEFLVQSSGDLPLITPGAVAAVCTAGEARQADFIYPVADMDQLKARHPQADKTSWRVGGKRIAGGNVFWIRRQWLLELEPLIEHIFARRKNPLALAQLFGPWFLIRVALGWADLPYLERRLGSLAAGRLCAELLPYPELVLDLDKADDLPAFEAFLDPLPTAQS